MVVSWAKNVNKDFFGADYEYLENTEQTEFASGRKVFYLKDATPTKKISLNLRVDDKTKIDGLTEFQRFLIWYETSLCSGANEVFLTDLIDHETINTYRLVEPPTWSGQKDKTISLVFEETH